MFQPGCLYSFSDRALVDRTRWPLFSMDDCSCQAPWLPHEIVDIVPMTSFILPATPFDQLYSLALDDVQCYGVSGPASCAWIDCCDYYSTTTAKEKEKVSLYLQSIYAAKIHISGIHCQDTYFRRRLPRPCRSSSCRRISPNVGLVV